MHSGRLNSSAVLYTAFTFLVALTGFAAPACAADAVGTPAVANDRIPAVVARVNGKAVTMKELRKMLAPKLAQLELQRRRLFENGVKQLVDQKLLEAEAAARGISVQQLVKTEIDARATGVTDAQAEAFYEANKARIRQQPKEKLIPQIKSYLTRQKQQQLRNDLLARLRTKYKAKILLEPVRADVADPTAPSKGPADAPVTIVEFADFQCPYCKRVLPSIEQALKTYPGLVRLVYRQFPLSIHPFAEKAAEASLCAREQGKFWEMHDAMFGNQRALGVDQLKAEAARLGMNTRQFNQCLDLSKYADRIRTDMTAGTAAGVTGTPALFVNGRFLNGAVPFRSIQKLIEDELARKGIGRKKHG